MNTQNILRLVNESFVLDLSQNSAFNTIFNQALKDAKFHGTYPADKFKLFIDKQKLSRKIYIDCWKFALNNAFNNTTPPQSVQHFLTKKTDDYRDIFEIHTLLFVKELINKNFLTPQNLYFYYENKNSKYHSLSVEFIKKLKTYIANSNTMDFNDNKSLVSFVLRNVLLANPDIMNSISTGMIISCLADIKEKIKSGKDIHKELQKFIVCCKYLTMFSNKNITHHINYTNFFTVKLVFPKLSKLNIRIEEYYDDIYEIISSALSNNNTINVKIDNSVIFTQPIQNTYKLDLIKRKLVLNYANIKNQLAKIDNSATQNKVDIEHLSVADQSAYYTILSKVRLSLDFNDKNRREQYQSQIVTALMKYTNNNKQAATNIYTDELKRVTDELKAQKEKPYYDRFRKR